jgi:hypothetical protein
MTSEDVRDILELSRPDKLSSKIENVKKVRLIG